LIREKPSSPIRIEESAPHALLHAFLQYLYSDSLDSSKFTIDQYRFFLDVLTEKLGPEHKARLTEELLATRVIIPSTMGRDMDYAWTSKIFSDVAFEVEGRQVACDKVLFISSSIRLLKYSDTDGA
jgi:hypothetical protein